MDKTKLRVCSRNVWKGFVESDDWEMAKYFLGAFSLAIGIVFVLGLWAYAWQTYAGVDPIVSIFGFAVLWMIGWGIKQIVVRFKEECREYDLEN